VLKKADLMLFLSKITWKQKMMRCADEVGSDFPVAGLCRNILPTKYPDWQSAGTGDQEANYK